MPYLYCEKHGQEQLNEVKGAEWPYPGEYMKIATGQLSSSYLCDKCNSSIESGDTAFFVGSYPDHYKDKLEFNYFNDPQVYFFPEREEVEDPSLSITPISTDDLEHFFDETK